MTAGPACRLCGSANSLPRFPRSAQPLLICRDCGVVFRRSAAAAPIPSLYNEEYYLRTWPGSLGRFFRDFDPAAHHKTRFFIRQLQEFERLQGGPGRLLDVGCANGVFVWLAQKRGWQAEGLEPSAFAAEWGRKQFGVTIHEQTLADFHPEHEFDLLTMWDTLEHLPEPRETLKRCFQRLRPGGRLGLLTPDSASLVNLLVHAAHRVAPRFTEPYLKRLYHDDHLVCFDRHTLARALIDQGFILHWIQGYDEAPADTETQGLLRAGVLIAHAAAALLHREHELLCWAEKGEERREA